MCSVNEARRIVFYRTLAIDQDSRVGSDVRPAKLLGAFRQLGYEVDVVAGPAPTRRQAIEDVKRKIAAGVTYSFLYAEPPTTPIALNESHHLPTHPLLDYRFLGFIHGRGIPVILFYSDVQWRLPGYRDRIGWARYLAPRPFFYLDLYAYSRVIDALIVPDKAMLGQVGRLAARKPSWTSIPGFDPLEVPPDRQPSPKGGALRLFYVGGMEPPVYDLEPLLRGIEYARSRGLQLELTICCREPEWKRRPATYDRYLGGHVTIVHNRNRQELLELYARHDIAVMPYGTLNAAWAMPVKFPEAIGMGLPVLAGAGTPVAKAVEQQGIGWSVGATDDDFYTVLRGIDAQELERARSAVQRVRPMYSWTERAREITAIADELLVSGNRVPRPA